MPTKTAKKNAAKAKRAGKSPSTQAGAFVKEKMHAMKRGSKKVKSKKQAIAIGLSEARQAGIKVGKKKTASRGVAKRKDPTSVSQPVEHETPLSSLESHMKHPEPTHELNASSAQESRRKKNLAKKRTYTGKEHSLSHARSNASQYRG